MVFDASTPESRLLDYACHLEFHKTGCQAIYVHISNLRSDVRGTQNVKQAEKVLSDLATLYQGELFRLRNCDLACIVKGAPVEELGDALTDLCAPFEKDPLVRVAIDSFMKQYNLDTDYDDFLTFVKVQRQHIEYQGVRASNRPEEVDFNDPAMVQTILGFAPPTAFVKQQTIYRIDPGGLLHPVVHEMAHKPNALTNVMLEGVLVDSNPQAKAQAKTHLDKQLLSVLPHMLDPWPSPWALQTSLDVITSAEFLIFHRYWSDQHECDDGQAPWFFVDVGDIEGNLEKFRYAKSFLQETPFRLAVSDLTFPQLIELDKEVADLHALCCVVPTREKRDDTFDNMLTVVLHHFGPDKLVVWGCDDVQTLTDMRAAGARLVHGQAAGAVFAGEEHWVAQSSCAS